MAAKVFQHIGVYPFFESKVLIEWRLHPRFCAPGPYTYTIEVSDSENGEHGWIELATVTDTDHAYLPGPPRWSVLDDRYYRIRLNAYEQPEHTSPVAPAWGSIPRKERLLAREIARREQLRFEKTGAGVKGYLLRRRWWGELHKPAIDLNTLEVTDPHNTVSFGTPYKGGYFAGIEYWIDLDKAPSRSFRRGREGTQNPRERRGRGLAWPPPASYDIWVDRSSGRRYYVNAAESGASIRGLPVVVNLAISEAPPTDIAYQVPIVLPEVTGPGST